MNEEIKQKIIEAFKEDRVDLDTLAGKLYITKSQTKLLLESWGLEVIKKRKKVQTPDRDELMKAYKEKGNTAELAKHYQTGIGTVNRWMKNLQIPTVKLVGMNKEKKAEYLEKHISKLNNLDF